MLEWPFVSYRFTRASGLRSVLLLGSLGLVGACEGDPPSSPDGAPPAVDASSPDAADLPCSAEESQTYYADLDGDTYGDPELTAVDCSMPAGFVDNMLDCDDRDSRVSPDGSELCDGLDNDCNPATTEVCANSCSPRLREGDTYLFCALGRNFSLAKSACIAEGMHLIRINDVAEQTWMSAERSAVFGGFPQVWMGGNDTTSEGVWVWHDDEQFWQGGSGGSAQGDLYTRWRGGEPNNGDGVEDCGTVENNAAGRWDDRPCGDGYRFICERDREVLP